MELLIGAFLGAVVVKLIGVYKEKIDKPYKFDCIHCRNGGRQTVFSSSDKNIVGMMADEHKRDFHPYAA